MWCKYEAYQAVSCSKWMEYICYIALCNAGMCLYVPMYGGVCYGAIWTIVTIYYYIVTIFSPDVLLFNIMTPW
jgi:hypothetical protein